MSNAHFALLLARDLQVELANETGAHNYDAVNNAALMGYFWAKAEAEFNIKPSARANLEARNSSRQGGKKSGDRRRENARDGWMQVAARMAKDLRNENPHISQEDLAFEIKAVWKDPRTKAPGASRLKQYIGDLEKSNLLDKRRSKPNEVRRRQLG